MFLNLGHQNLKVYSISRGFVLECYKIANRLPLEERFGMTQQIKRAALSVHLNIAEGFSRKSPNERKRFFEISRGSIIEIDAAFDIASDLDYLNTIDTQKLGTTMIDCLKYVSGLINSIIKSKNDKE